MTLNVSNHPNEGSYCSYTLGSGYMVLAWGYMVDSGIWSIFGRFQFPYP